MADDEDVERFVPFRHEGFDGISIDQVEVRDMNARVVGGPSNVGCRSLTGRHISHGQRDGGARTG